MANPRALPFIPLPTTSSAAELSRLPREVRLPAMFSARMNLVAPLVEMGAQAQGILDGTVSQSDARLAIRNALAAAGYEPPQEKGQDDLLDHTSKTRLDLILEMNVRKARGYAKRVADMDDDALFLFPAQQLVRVRQSQAPRDWTKRWKDAGGSIHGGKMAALKTDPVWANLSRFGEPFPPFDFGSGMGVADIDRDEAVRLGLLTEDQELTPDPPQMPAFAQGLPGVSGMPALRDAVAQSMQDLAAFDGDLLTILQDYEPAPLEGALAESTISHPPARIEPEEALAMMDAGAAKVVSPASGLVEFTRNFPGHWTGKKTPLDIERRLSNIRYAMAAVREPQETWTERGRDYYLKIFDDGRGAYVVVNNGKVETFIVTSRLREVEKKRSGQIMHRVGNKTGGEA